MRFRDVSIRVKGNKPAHLVDVCAYPALPMTFATMDDYGICRESDHHPSQQKTCILLAPNKVYPISLVLDTLDGTHRRYEADRHKGLWLAGQASIVEEMMFMPFWIVLQGCSMTLACHQCFWAVDAGRSKGYQRPDLVGMKTLGDVNLSSLDKGSLVAGLRV